jgi:hypothetical protein
LPIYLVDEPVCLLQRLSCLHARPFFFNYKLGI